MTLSESPSRPLDPDSLLWGVASVRSGQLLDAHCAHPQAEPIVELAATLPEVFQTLDTSCVERLALKLGEQPGSTAFVELVLLGTDSVRIVRALTTEVDTAFVAVGSTKIPIGLVLSEVHHRVARLERSE
jgi:hypothetical protein